MISASKYVVLQAKTTPSEGQEKTGPTFLKILYLDTSPAFFRPGLEKGWSRVICDKPISNAFVTNAHLLAGKPEHVARLVLEVI